MYIHIHIYIFICMRKKWSLELYCVDSAVAFLCSLNKKKKSSNMYMRETGRHRE